MAEREEGYRESDEVEPEWIEPFVPDLDTPFEISPELQHHNLQDLLQVYYYDTEAPRAAEVFDPLERRSDNRDLGIVLRNHRTQGIRDVQEILDRGALDDLLTCYSVLEIATQVDYVAPLDEEFRARATRILDRAEVRPYYESYYPLLLPQLFRARLEGIDPIQVHRGPRQVAGLQRILELDSRFMRNPEVRVFLALADDIQIRGFTREQLFQVVSDPEQLAERLGRPREKRDKLDEALRGLRGFLFLSDGLYRALKTLDGDALYQSTLWHLFGYWYSDRSGAVVPSVLQILDRFDAWGSGGLEEAEQDFALPGQGGTEAIRGAIEALSSGRYARPLEEEGDRILQAVPIVAVGFDPSDMIRDLVRSLEEKAQRQGIKLHADIATKLPRVAIKPDQLAHALGMVIDNAVKCTPANGYVTITAHADYVNPSKDVTMMVSCRPLENVWQKLLYSYFPGRRKKRDEFAMAIVQRMIAENDGRMTLEYPGGIGMDYRIVLPGKEQSRVDSR